MKKFAGIFLPFFIIATAVYLFVFYKPTVAPYASRPKAETSQKIIKIGGKNIAVEIADTEASRIKGLSGREGLPSDTGLLFYFDKPQRAGIWMKEMKFAIDIVWVGTDMRIVKIQKNATPSSFPEFFLPAVITPYVIEFNVGFTEKNNISVGDIVVI